MVDKFFSLFTTALIVTALGIALRPGSQAPAVIRAWMSGFASVQRAASAR
jgi:hypothetical protein